MSASATATAAAAASLRAMPNDARVFTPKL
jgi:hypothetical protein